MKTYHIFFVLLLAAVTSGCGAINFLPGQAPAQPTQAATSRATPLTVTPAPTDTVTPTLTPLPTETMTPTITPTFTPLPTRTSPYPIGLGTPLPDLGFPEITTDNISQLSPVFRIVHQHILMSATSADSQELFVATNTGMYVYDRQGTQLQYWPSIIPYDLPCDNCLSINRDGSRFVIVTRKDGQWYAQVYNVYEKGVNLLLEKPLDTPFDGVSNDNHVAISPDGVWLAYSTGDGETLVIDMNDSHPLLTYKGGSDAITFLPDGSLFSIRRGREILFWGTTKWKNPANLLLPADDTPYAFSPDGALIAIAFSNKVRAYTLDTLKPTHEIAIQPANILNRSWQLEFINGVTLIGYSVRWDDSHTTATVDFGMWDVSTGKTLKRDTSETNSPDALSTLWGVPIPITAASQALQTSGAAEVTPTPSVLVESPDITSTPSASEVPEPTQTQTAAKDVLVGEYERFGFVSQDQLLINTPHTACWMKLSTGERTCFTDSQYNVLASQTGAYKEVPEKNSMLLQSWTGDTLFTILGPYHIVGMSRTAEYILVNVNDATVDIYFTAKKTPAESIAGTLLSYAEGIHQLVVSAREKSGLVTVTIFDKDQSHTLYQKRGDFILGPVAITNSGNVYYLASDPSRSQIILEAIDPDTHDVTDLAHLPFSSEPRAMTVSSSGMFALGMQDGEIIVISPDGQQIVNFQALYTPVTGISFTPDGHYLAVASGEGIRILAVLPQK